MKFPRNGENTCHLCTVHRRANLVGSVAQYITRTSLRPHQQQV